MSKYESEVEHLESKYKRLQRCVIEKHKKIQHFKNNERVVLEMLQLLKV